MTDHKHLSNLRGMSLVELILVVCIIGVFAAVATIPFSRATTETQLNNAADRLVTDLVAVRDQARKEQKIFSLIFNPDDHSYHADGVTDIDNTQEISVDMLDDDRYKLTEIEVNMNDQSKTITFNQLGYAAVEGVITLVKGNRAITIVIFENGKIAKQSSGW